MVPDIPRKKKIPKRPKDATRAFEEALRTAETEKYVLRLYVAGSTPRSVRAISNLKKICQDNLQGRCDLEVIDVYQEPDRIKGEQIIAVPTLIKSLPLPLKKFIGDLADQEKILVGLDLRKKESEDPDSGN